MKLLSWLRPARHTPARRPAAFRPQLEALDDRALPSTLGFSTALRGAAYGMAVDSAGDTYITTNGTTGVYKFDPAGNLLASNTSVAGAGGGVALDAAGDVYLNNQGVITELDPTLQTTLFTVTLPGARLSGYGGSPGTSGNGTVAFAGGKIYAVGAAGAGLPTTATAFQAAFPGTATGLLSAYVAVIDPVSTAPYHLTYCSYVGGTTLVPSMPASAYGYAKGASASGVAVDAAGDVYLTGSTDAADFPTTAGAFQRVNRGGTIATTAYGGTSGWTSYVAKLDPAQSGSASLVYSTFLGGSSMDGSVSDGRAVSVPSSGPSIAVDAAGNAYVAGTTTSADFPVTAGAFQTAFVPVQTYGTYYAPSHAYITKLNRTGTGLVYSTLLGGHGGDGANGGIAVDATGNVWVTGWTRSADFPVTAGALQSAHSAGYIYTSTNKKGQVTGGILNGDAYVVELNAAGSGLLYSTYWGGSGHESGMAIGLDAFGNVFVAGEAGTGYPTTPWAYQTTGSGFLLKFRP